MARLDKFADGFEREVVAYAFQLAKTSEFDDPDVPDRNHGWSWYVRRDEPSEDNWKQEDVVKHRIRNVTPLVRGPVDVSTDDAMAFEYEYTSYDGEVVEKLGVDDPRGSDAVVRCTPLVPESHFEGP